MFWSPSSLLMVVINKLGTFLLWRTLKLNNGELPQRYNNTISPEIFWIILCNIDHNISNVWQEKTRENLMVEVWRIKMKTEKRKKFITISSENKRRINVQCQAMFGSFLAPSSTVWADESQERTKILLVIILHLQLLSSLLLLCNCPNCDW